LARAANEAVYFFFCTWQLNNYYTFLQLGNCFRFSFSERKKENHSCTFSALFSEVQTGFVFAGFC